MVDQCLLLCSWTEKGDTSQLWRCFLESSTTKASPLFATSHWHPPWYFDSPSSLPGLKCSTQTCKTNQNLRLSPKALQSSSPWFISWPDNFSCFFFTLGQQLLLMEYMYINYWIRSFTCIASFWWFTHNYFHSKKWGNGLREKLRSLLGVPDSELKIDWNLGLLTPTPVHNGCIFAFCGRKLSHLYSFFPWDTPLSRFFFLPATLLGF